MSMAVGNPTPPVSSCMYSSIWAQKDWIVREDEQRDEFYSSQVTAPLGPSASAADGLEDDNGYVKVSAEQPTCTRPLREKNGKKSRGYKHVPHKDKPVQVVAKRNARERRRVQAVNGAFVRLRKAVPVENVRGKRISKVKTLQNAINYIHNLQQLLEQDRSYHVISHYYCHKNQDFFQDFDFADEL